MLFVCKGCDKHWNTPAPEDWFYIQIGNTKKGPYCEGCEPEARWILAGKPYPPRKTFRRWLGDLIGGRR